MDAALARQVVEDDLGRPISAMFASFTDEPMAAASIGQVHRAVLHDGRDAVVKIQYPGVAQAIRDDLSNTELLATMFRFAAGAASTLGTILPDVAPIAAEISERISEEIDYRREAAHITAFSALWRDHPYVRVPELISAASGDRVLTMTYLDGLDWAAAQDADQSTKDTWSEVIARFVTGSYRHGHVPRRPAPRQLPIRPRRHRRIRRLRLRKSTSRRSAQTHREPDALRRRGTPGRPEVEHGRKWFLRSRFRADRR